MLKQWNGRAYSNHGHLYIAAKNQTDAARLLLIAYPYTTLSYWQRELKTYFSKCWGNSMEGIPVVRGIWYDKNKYSEDAPVPVVDGETNQKIGEVQ